MQVSKTVVTMAVLVVVVGAIVVGCGGGTSQFVPPDTVITAATFVGRAVCATCHGHIDTEYSEQNHGLDFRVVHGDQIEGFGGGCAPCHTTGYDEPSGFVLGGSTPDLEGIGCEECHGPGSQHAADPSELNIQVVPTAENSCWDCHAAGYKQLKGYVGPTTDANLSGTKPGSVSVHHPQGIFLLGVYGYNRSGEPGPHRWVDNTCVTCHMNPIQSTVPLHVGVPASHDDESLHPDLTSCAYCHGSEGAALAEFEELEEEIIEQLIELGGEDPADPGHPDHGVGGGLLAAYAAAHGIDLAANSDPDNPAVQAYKGARHSFMFVLNDGSYGTHNPGFAKNLLEDARSLLSN